MMRSCEEDEFQLFVEIARQMWFGRNETVHGGPFTHPTALVQQAREAIDDYSNATSLLLAFEGSIRARSVVHLFKMWWKR